MKIANRLFAIIIGLLAVSCQSKPDVIVTDAAGVPIAGAAVEPVTASMNLPAVVTDAKGEVHIGGAAQPVQSINVSKTGFTGVNNIDYTTAKPIRVILKP
ncbi:carboxypeptidase-like regulatory domain-containing protein [Luteolibacter flavescens]|uniref:Carboxypeptidase-like regulatory domain-containing protein n=1 Tax=Luteolibacter flavescens TaxID=1859460 RepID=A0ABT3FJF5_9BACT|nr:carboxypeptidase-like regulatory domain-containing protein [Luteolibacter flavescens]MCW1883704.1 carboxypeptidase-like regulatory domain-containing protein [Luteolibacter flavescens]